jgi:hypothetical protein
MPSHYWFSFALDRADPAPAILCMDTVYENEHGGGPCAERGARARARAQAPLRAPFRRLYSFVNTMLRAPAAARPLPACSPPPQRRASLRARASVAGGKDRGEWTRFLEWSDTAADGDKATVEVALLSEPGGVAQVSVEAPDRPGLLGDIANTIVSLGLNIEKVRTRPLWVPASPTGQSTCVQDGWQLGHAEQSQTASDQRRRAASVACVRPGLAALLRCRMPRRGVRSRRRPVGWGASGLTWRGAGRRK